MQIELYGGANSAINAAVAAVRASTSLIGKQGLNASHAPSLEIGYTIVLCTLLTPCSPQIMSCAWTQRRCRSPLRYGQMPNGLQNLLVLHGIVHVLEGKYQILIPHSTRIC